MYYRISFNLALNPKKGSDPGCGSNRCLKADTVSHKPTSETWQTGLIVQVLGQIQSHSWLQRARSFTHLWPINTASVNITVRHCDLCLTLVTRGITERQGVHITNKLKQRKIHLLGWWSCLCRWDRECRLQDAVSKRVFRNAEQCVGLFVQDFFAHRKYIWSDVIFKACPWVRANPIQ